MIRPAVRRVNEWDGPSMLKIYAPYTFPGTPFAPEDSLPELQDYVQRIDTYTYGLGWLLAELNSHPVGFCHLTENRREPKNLFSVEFQLYVRQDFRRMGVGLALWSLMRDMMEVGSRREVFARVDIRNPDAIAFFQAMGFPEQGREEGLALLRYALNPADPQAERPVKPYLIDKFDYEPARERAAALIHLERAAPFMDCL